jgi:hypothetical protein
MFAYVSAHILMCLFVFGWQCDPVHNASIFPRASQQQFVIWWNLQHKKWHGICVYRMHLRKKTNLPYPCLSLLYTYGHGCTQFKSWVVSTYIFCQQLLCRRFKTCKSPSATQTSTVIQNPVSESSIIFDVCLFSAYLFVLFSTQPSAASSKIFQHFQICFSEIVSTCGQEQMI